MPDISLPTDPASVGISPERLHEAVAALCALGRKLPGSAAERAACDIIARRLAACGVAHEVHEFEAFIGWPVRSELVLGERRLAAAGVAFAAGTPEDGLVAPLAAPGSDPRGRILLSEGLPRYDALRAAERAGALGLVAISGGEQRHYVQATPIWGAPTGPGDLALLPGIPAAQVSRADGAALRALAEAGGTVRLIAEARRAWVTARMPVAEIPGREDFFVLLGAHYCTWQDGATDNLAGVALLLELARLYAEARPRYGLRIAFWTGHEQGAYAGSSWYADRFWNALHDRAIAYLNVDIVGVRGGTTKALRNTTGELARYAEAVLAATAGTLPAAERDFVARALRRQDRDVDPRRSARNSDQSFCGIGLSGAQVSSFLPAASSEHLPESGLAWWWQTDQDTLERCDAAVLAEDTLIYRNLVEGLVNAPALPFDFATTAEDMLASLAEYRDAAPDVGELAALAALAERLRAAAGTARLSDAGKLRVARQLNPVLYHARSAFEYDPGRASRLLPGLAPALALAGMPADEARMARVALRRQANRVEHALRRALELMDAAR